MNARFSFLAAMLAALLMAPSRAQAAFMFTPPATSSGTVTHTPHPTVGPSVGKTSTGYTAAMLNGSVILDHDTTYTSGSSKSIGRGGIDHKTSGGPDGVANLTIAAGSGVSQTDKGAFGGNTSTLALDFDLFWDVSDGWGSAVSVYQAILVTLKTSGKSDLASISGTFTYRLDLNNGAFPGVDFMSTIGYGATQTNVGGTTTTNKFLYTSGLLTPGAVPAAAGGDNHILYLDGIITFSAKDPTGPADIETFFDPVLYQVLLGPLLGTGAPEEHFQNLGGGPIAANITPGQRDDIISQESIPEPATLLLSALLAGGALMRRRAPLVRGPAVERSR